MNVNGEKMAKWGMFGRFANTLVFLFSDSIASCLSVKISSIVSKDG